VGICFVRIIDCLELRIFVMPAAVPASHRTRCGFKPALDVLYEIPALRFTPAGMTSEDIF